MNCYIVGVSGGLDSITLLHLLVNHPELLNFRCDKLVVAHINHGIRPDTDKTEKFVEKLAAGYGLEFASIKLKVDGVSEAELRSKRYQAFSRLKLRYGAKAIITAHTKSDARETAIINMVRGTGWRGLCSLQSGDDIVRPILNLTRSDIVGIAARANLTWHEDSTNSDTAYLRNSIRQKVMPKLSNEDLIKLDDIINNLSDIKLQVDDIFKNLLDINVIDKGKLSYSFNRTWVSGSSFGKKMLTELLVYAIAKLNTTYNKKVIEAMANFCLKAVNGKRFLQAGKNFELTCTKLNSDYRLTFCDKTISL